MSVAAGIPIDTSVDMPMANSTGVSMDNLSPDDATIRS